MVAPAKAINRRVLGTPKTQKSDPCGSGQQTGDVTGDHPGAGTSKVKSSDFTPSVVKELPKHHPAEPNQEVPGYVTRPALPCHGTVPVHETRLGIAILICETGVTVRPILQACEYQKSQLHMQKNI